MSSRGINNYRLFCNTESAFVTVWNVNTPKVCPNNNMHLIDNDSITIIDNVSSNASNIVQYNNDINGNFRTESKILFIPANQIITQLYKWPYNISIMTIGWTSAEENRGDIVNVYIAPNTVIGGITQHINIGDTIIHVSPTVVKYLNVGFCVKITNGTSVLDLGECILIDPVTYIIHCTNSANISMNAGSYVQMTIHNIKNIYLHNPEQFKIGEKHVNSQSLPSNTTVQLSYQNNSNVDKHFMFYYEFLY